MLAGKGFKQVYNLQGGMRAWNGVKAFGPRELNMELLRGDETPAEITLFAYGMENALGGFYSSMLERAGDNDLKDLFSKLAGIEQRHREMIFSLYRSREPSGMDLPAFESKVTAEIMEGGFAMDGFMSSNEPYLHTVTDVLNIAMMIETQAMDLYLRYAEKSADMGTREALFTIADEEKAHLASLGRLMGEKA